MDFGREVLTLPLLVEAFETEFVPLCIFNNVKEEAHLLKRYEEPSWNNPVVRFFSADDKDLIPRKDRVWKPDALLPRVVASLRAAKCEVPAYLTLLADDVRAASFERATFAMYCFWEGEKQLGRIDGVVSTEAGWLDGKEVVELVYDPARVDYAKLVTEARGVKCCSKVYARTDAQLEAANGVIDASRTDEAIKLAKDSDRKYYLTKSPLRYLPMTPAQATKVNAALAAKAPYTTFLSPRQRALAKRLLSLSSDQQKRLEGLRRPSKLSELAAYERELASRLG